MKKESVEEYLARGGTVEKLPYMGSPEQIQPVKVTAGINSMMSMEEGALYNGDKKKTKKKPAVKVDKSKIPADLLKSLENIGIKVE